MRRGGTGALLLFFVAAAPARAATVSCPQLIAGGARLETLALVEMTGTERYVRDNHLQRLVVELGRTERVPDAVRSAVETVDLLTLDRSGVARLASTLGLVTEEEQGVIYAALVRRLGVDSARTRIILKAMEEALAHGEVGARSRAHDALLAQIEKAVDRLRAAAAKLRGVSQGLARGDRAALTEAESVRLVLELHDRGHRTDEVRKLVDALHTDLPPPPPDQTQVAYFRERLRERGGLLPSVQRLQLNALPRPPPEGFFHPASREPVNFAVEGALRSVQGGHAIDAEAYIERHLSRGLMEALADDTGVRIRIYQGNILEALTDLQGSGFTELVSLPHNEFTDFAKMLARNPATGEVVFAVCGATGRAYGRELAAHFIYWGRGRTGARLFDPSRIEVLHSRESASQEILRGLREAGVDPDVVVIENGTEFDRLVAGGELGPHPAEPRRLIIPGLQGRVLSSCGKIILSVSVEPWAYADRAGALVEALKRLSGKERTQVFLGTAGAVDRDMQVGDLVAPGQFADANGLAAIPVPSVTNDGVALMRRLGYDRQPGVHVGDGVRHGAVDSILFEDRVWIAAHRGSLTPLSVVEQELASLVSAARGGRNRLYLYLRISDIVGSEHHDFSRQELYRPAPRPRVTPWELLRETMREVLGAPTAP